VGDAAGRKGDFSAADEGFAQVSGLLPSFRNVAHVHSFRLLFEFRVKKVRMSRSPADKLQNFGMQVTAPSNSRFFRSPYAMKMHNVGLL
jgi:hypothetical protein